MFYALDWGFKAEKAVFFDGKKTSRKTPDIGQGDVIACENIPAKLADDLLDAGAQIMRCSPTDTTVYRKAKGQEKTDEPEQDEKDAVLIYNLYEEAPQLFRSFWGVPRIRTLFKQYLQAKKMLIQTRQRLYFLSDNDPLLNELVKLQEAGKRKVANAITKQLKDAPIWGAWLSEIYGVGPAVAAGLVGYIGELAEDRTTLVMKEFPYPSGLVHYCGLHNDKDGKAAKRKKGQVADWNSILKPLLAFDFAAQVERKDSEYRPVYDKAKAQKEGNGWTPGHRRNHALRVAVKRFIQDLWVVWRTIEDKPLAMPYPIAKDGHSTYSLPAKCPPDVELELRKWAATWAKEVGREIRVVEFVA